jgi:rubrerythrin
MTAFNDTSEPRSAVFEEAVAALLARAPVTRRFGRSRPLHCPDCGHLMYADSGLAGTCPICPGLVPLARA